MQRKSIHKACRRYGVKLCQSDKCPATRRNYAPGVHGPNKAKKLTGYGLQLAEKQKAKILYGLTEKQFRSYYEEAAKKQGDTSEILRQNLERRLDNVIYRLGWAKTRAAARQMVNHGMFQVNDRNVNIPSFKVRVSEKISIKPEKTDKKLFTEMNKEALEKHDVPVWISSKPKEMTAKITGLPEVDQLEQLFNPRLIVEFYSR